MPSQPFEEARSWGEPTKIRGPRIQSPDKMVSLFGCHFLGLKTASFHVESLVRVAGKKLSSPLGFLTASDPQAHLGLKKASGTRSRENLSFVLASSLSHFVSGTFITFRWMILGVQKVCEHFRPCNPRRVCINGHAKPCGVPGVVPAMAREPESQRVFPRGPLIH